MFCGLSGSGKSSLAFDTLYAEGQRRYIESFSAYTRQFLDRLEKPDAERIDGMPPAIAVTAGGGSRSNRATVGTATEADDYLRLMFAKIGQVFCRKCGREVRRDTPQSAAGGVGRAARRARGIWSRFRWHASGESIRRDGSGIARSRVLCGLIAGERVVSLDEITYIVRGRSTELGGTTYGSAYTSWSIGLPPAARREQRIRDSLETAFAKGNGKCCAFVVER